VNIQLCYGFGSLYGDIAKWISPSSFYLERIQFKCRGIGYTVSWEFSIRLVSGFSIDNTIGYRHLVTGELEAPNGKRIENSNLNFSGFLISGGISINPWGK
jgi:hypothetical protein